MNHRNSSSDKLTGQWWFVGLHSPLVWLWSWTVNAFESGWFEAFESSDVRDEQVACPVKRLAKSCSERLGDSLNAAEALAHDRTH